MKTDRWILIAIIIFCVVLVWKLLPKNKLRDACVIFLSMQLITWGAGLFVAEMGWIVYPIQLLPNENNINRSSFSYEFLILPLIAVLFSLYFPTNSSKRIKFPYYFGIAAIFTIPEVILEKTTDLLKYHGWKWYWTFIGLIITLFFNHLYYTWFKKHLKNGESW